MGTKLSPSEIRSKIILQSGAIFTNILYISLISKATTITFIITITTHYFPASVEHSTMQRCITSLWHDQAKTTSPTPLPRPPKTQRTIRWKHWLLISVQFYLLDRNRCWCRYIAEIHPKDVLCAFYHGSKKFLNVTNTTTFEKLFLTFFLNYCEKLV